MRIIIKCLRVEYFSVEIGSVTPCDADVVALRTAVAAVVVVGPLDYGGLVYFVAT